MKRACKSCHFLAEEPLCPNCGDPMSKNWSGILTVLEPEKSQMAQAMNIKKPGSYALKVR